MPGLYTALSSPTVNRGTARKKYGKTYATDLFNPAIDEGQQRYQGLDTNAAATRGSAVSRIQGFDPRSYMKDAAGAAYGDLREQYDLDTGRRQEQLNARGLFGSNLGGAAQNRDFNTRLSRALAGQALQAGNLELGAAGQEAGLYRTDAYRADQGRTEYLDLLTGGRDYETAQENLRRKRKGGLFGALGGIAGGIGGFALGGPAGAAVGAKIGSGIGGAF